MGGALKYPPDVAVVEDKMEVYITGKDNVMYRKTWENDKWSSGWETMGGSVESKPNPVVWDNGKVDVYGTGTDGGCKRFY